MTSSGVICSSASTLDNVNNSSISLAIRLASLSIIDKKRVLASGSLLAGPCKVSIKPRRAERGDLNSWLTFATKSDLTFSIRLVLVTSERTIMAQTGLFAVRSGNRHILTS